MDYNTPDLNSWPAKLVLRVGKKLRSNKSFTQGAIAKNNAREIERRQKREQEYARRNGWEVRSSVDTAASGRSRPSFQSGVNELGERKYSIFSEAPTLVEHRDHGEMMHSLAHSDSFDELLGQIEAAKSKSSHYDSFDVEKRRALSAKHERLVERLPHETWRHVAEYLSVADAASLTMATKTLWSKIGSSPLEALKLPENRHQKITFLRHLDRHLPRHLMCFPCAKYHLRLRPGKESLKSDYVNYPLVACPQVRDTTLPRMRLTYARELPYGFVQLALRSSHSPAHGIRPDDLARRWTHAESGWSHRTRYMIHESRLLMRVVSQRHTPPASTLTKTAERHILYDGYDYTPFFSVCAHWRDGDLMDICKCAMSHVPASPESYLDQLKKAPKISRELARPNFIVRGCDWCRPARRCPECPTEYLVDIQMAEDTKDLSRPFKHNLVVTRWSDLGDGSSPYTSPEWAAVTGTSVLDEAGGEHYESFSHLGRRAVSGIFESRISGSVPGERMLSLNPKNKKLTEDSHGWF